VRKTTSHPEVGAGEVDWRHSGKVNKIKDQKQCGSCWAFSSVCAVESAYAIAHKHLYSFAEQQLVDCEPKSKGCRGGYINQAFKYFEKHAAIEEQDYTYTAVTGSCQAEGKKATAVKTTGYVNVTPNSPSQMKAALA